MVRRSATPKHHSSPGLPAVIPRNYGAEYHYTICKHSPRLGLKQPQVVPQEMEFVYDLNPNQQDHTRPLGLEILLMARYEITSPIRGVPTKGYGIRPYVRVPERCQGLFKLPIFRGFPS